jgi:putative flippase GtrA
MRAFYGDLRMRALYRRWQVIVHELAKFGIVGAFNTVLDFGVFNLLRAGFHVGPLTSSTIALVIAATSSYFMNRHWTFRHRARSGVGREYSLFFLLNGIGLGLQLTCLAVSHYGLGFDSLVADNIAKAVGLVIGTIFRFTTYKRWVFMSQERAAARAAVAGLADEVLAGERTGTAGVHLASALGNGHDPAGVRVDGGGLRVRSLQLRTRRARRGRSVSERS